MAMRKIAVTISIGVEIEADIDPDNWTWDDIYDQALDEARTSRLSNVEITSAEEVN